MDAAGPAGIADVVEGREWYHTLELHPGLTTPGWFDTRPVAKRVLPPRLDGSRCLDIATADGFWAFELERRGASEVVAADILDPHGWDWPADSTSETVAAIERRKEHGVGFKLACESFGSRVQYVETSVYDLDPDGLGQFDFVYMGSLLLHLRDPIRALERVRSVCRGQLLSVEALDLPLSVALPRRPTAYLDGRGRPWWWRPNRAALVRMYEAAGFQIIQRPKLVFMPAGRGHPRPAVRPRLLLRSKEARELTFAAMFGAPHLATLSRPDAV
jgi:tRNA (mo5U34)-methyltransferase